MAVSAGSLLTTSISATQTNSDHLLITPSQHDIQIPDTVRQDGHDNNRLLLEFLLALPFSTLTFRPCIQA